MEMPIDIQHQQMGYDRTATMFSPEGHLLQVEYAEKTVRLGPLSIAMVCTDGVFIIADKRVKDKLIAQTSAMKIHEIDSHIIASTAGIVADARILIEKAQVIAQQHQLTYDSPVPTESVTKDIADIKQQFSQYGGARPFGVSLMMAGITNKKPELFTSDVTGNYMSYHANAIGENDEKARDLLRERFRKDMSIKEGVRVALEILEEIKQNDFKLDNLELAYIPKEGKITRLEGEKIREL
jgi:proteasome alpha subunit